MEDLAACALVAALSVITGQLALEDAAAELAIVLRWLGSGSIRACA